MPKLLPAFIAILLVATVNAQTKVGLKAGYNYSTGKVTYNGVKQPVAGKSGFGLMMMAKVPFDGLLHFSPSVGYNMRGFILSPHSGTNSREQYTLHYIDLVPALSLDIPAGENSFVISGGPVLGVTNFGNLKATNRITGITSNEKIKFGYGGYGWFDLGITAGVGYHLQKIFVEALYMNGLSSINNNEETDKRNMRNRMFSLNIGYYFR